MIRYLCILLPMLMWFGGATPRPAVNALPTTYYVDPQGSDTNPGTSAAPICTRQRAAAVVRAGVTVRVRKGSIYGNNLSGMDCDRVQNSVFRNNIVYGNDKHTITCTTTTRRAGAWTT